jgi:hypothetical protein
VVWLKVVLRCELEEAWVGGELAERARIDDLTAGGVVVRTTVTWLTEGWGVEEVEDVGAHCRYWLSKVVKFLNTLMLMRW